MSESKIKVKIGEHEFEAEGPVDVVNAQFEIFKELIKHPTDYKNKTESRLVVDSPITSNLDRIFSLSNERVVFLSDTSKSANDAILLIIYGQKQCRNNEAATGGEIKAGLIATGYNGQEISRRLRELRHENLIAAQGTHRAKRYKLTNSGMSKVKTMLQEMPQTRINFQYDEPPISPSRRIVLKD